MNKTIYLFIICCLVAKYVYQKIPIIFCLFAYLLLDTYSCKMVIGTSSLYFIVLILVNSFKNIIARFNSSTVLEKRGHIQRTIPSPIIISDSYCHQKQSHMEIILYMLK